MAPRPGHYFAWVETGGAIASNRFRFAVTNASPTVSGQFYPLALGEHAFTVEVVGCGEVIAHPTGNRFGAGQIITLTAVPDVFQDFLGWGGDAMGTQNPLTLNLNEDASIAAHFTSHPQMLARRLVDSKQGAQFVLNGKLGAVYRLERSSNLESWALLATVTNALGIVQHTDSSLTNFQQGFYRAAQVR